VRVEAVSARDAAITLLALATGLRACDIIALRLADVDWRGQTISIVQQKTGNPLTLPLPALVAGKLARYVLGERPGSADDHVFLRSVAPHVRLADHASAPSWTSLGARSPPAAWSSRPQLR
jgi:integrase